MICELWLCKGAGDGLVSSLLLNRTVLGLVALTMGQADSQIILSKKRRLMHNSCAVLVGYVSIADNPEGALGGAEAILASLLEVLEVWEQGFVA